MQQLVGTCRVGAGCDLALSLAPNLYRQAKRWVCGYLRGKGWTRIQSIRSAFSPERCEPSRREAVLCRTLRTLVRCGTLEENGSGTNRAVRMRRPGLQAGRIVHRHRTRRRSQRVANLD